MDVSVASQSGSFYEVRVPQQWLWPHHTFVLHLADGALALSGVSLDICSLFCAIVVSLAVFRRDLRRRHLVARDVFRQPVLAILDLIPPGLTSGAIIALVIRFYPLLRTTAAVPIWFLQALALLMALLLLPIFWREGRKQIQFQRPVGLLFGEWLFSAGAILLLLSFLSRQHASKPWLDSYLYALLLLLSGVLVILCVVPPFVRKYEGIRILERVSHGHQFAQPECTPATPECPQPQLWSMLDSQTTELEVLNFLKSLVTTSKPKLIVETGTFLGHGTLKLAEGLKENGFGKVITVEFDQAIHASAEKRFEASGLAPWIELRLESSLETEIEGTIDLLYSDSHLANREKEIRRLLPQLDPRGLLVIHDASSHFKIVREAAQRLEAEGLISAVFLSTPRGIVVAQRREGRK